MLFWPTGECTGRGERGNCGVLWGAKERSPRLSRTRTARCACVCPERIHQRTSRRRRVTPMLVCLAAGLSLGVPSQSMTACTTARPLHDPPRTSQLLSGQFSQCSRAETERDSYYRQAKVLGFRARSAFKVGAPAHARPRKLHASTLRVRTFYPSGPHITQWLLLDRSCCSSTTSLAS